MNKSVSSASNRHSESKRSGKSSTYNKNKRGPKTEPCSTPEQILHNGHSAQSSEKIVFKVSINLESVVSIVYVYHNDLA